jgi:hypothetical protein
MGSSRVSLQHPLPEEQHPLPEEQHPLPEERSIVTDKPPGRFRPCIACLLRPVAAEAMRAPPEVVARQGGAADYASPGAVVARGLAVTASQHGAQAAACACAWLAEEPAAWASQHEAQAVAAVRRGAA